MRKSWVSVMLAVILLNAAQEAALARFCALEAAGEPLICRVGVAAAMLNRLSDSRYPDTVSGILSGAGFGGGHVPRELYDEALCAVRMAQLGVDPTHGATAWAHRGTARESELSVTLAAGRLVFGEER